MQVCLVLLFRDSTSIGAWLSYFWLSIMLIILQSNRQFYLTQTPINFLVHIFSHFNILQDLSHINMQYLDAKYVIQLIFKLVFIIDQILLYMQEQQTQRRQTQSKQQHSPQQSPQSDQERSREKQNHNKQQKQQTYVRKVNIYGKPNEQNFKQTIAQHNIQTQDPQQKQKANIKKQLLRSFLRIEQDREEPIDKFVKIVWILKGKFQYDHKIHDIMSEPKKYLQKLTESELTKMIPLAQGHKLYEHYSKTPEQQYWGNLIGLIKYLVQKKDQKQQKLQAEYEDRIKQIILKPLPQLIKLQKQTLMILKTQTFGSSQQQYWRQVLARIKIKRMELILNKFYQKYKQQNKDKINQKIDQVDEQALKEPTSPTLVPFSAVNPKLVVQQEQEKQQKRKLAQKIFKLQFEKGRQRLQINLSLPHNHDLLSTEIIAEQTNTYDTIAKEIIQFEKYKRMEEDQQDFNDWVPCQTEGKLRSQKPVYINRVRVACQWNKYNSMHYTQDNPPPKTIQGYKFNVFYPDLYDKQKTPQYYLQNTDDPNYCIIKFKAGPPYKDIAFKILKKEWDFTQKSGFQSIFAKGILHLYFNFKKPRYRI